MKKICLTYLLILITGLSYPQEKDLDQDNYRLGIVLGSPGPILLSFGQDFDKYSYRFGISEWRDSYGTQAEFIYNIYRRETFEQHIEILAGFNYSENQVDIKYIFIESHHGGNVYSFYSGVGYRLNWTNIFIQGSIAAGTGNYAYPRLLLQFGYYFNL